MEADCAKRVLSHTKHRLSQLREWEWVRDFADEERFDAVSVLSGIEWGKDLHGDTLPTISPAAPALTRISCSAGLGHSLHTVAEAMLTRRVKQIAGEGMIVTFPNKALRSPIEASITMSQTTLARSTSFDGVARMSARHAPS